MGARGAPMPRPKPVKRGGVMSVETEHDRIERMDLQIQGQQKDIEALSVALVRRQEIEDRIVSLMEKLVPVVVDNG